MDEELPEEIPTSEAAPQFPCSICSRTFRQEALERHEKFCQKSQSKKKKVFDSSKMRAEGTELAVYPPVKDNKPAKEKPKAKSDWRAKHEEFLRSIRAAKGVPDDEQGENNTNESSKQPAIPVGYIQCPTCGRNFSERAADRHLPWCKDKQNKSSKSPNINDASDRLKARTKYRAPLPLKKDSTSAKSEKKKPTPPPPPRIRVPLPVEPPPETKKFLSKKTPPTSKPASSRRPDANNNVRSNIQKPKKQQNADKRKSNSNQQKTEPPRKMIVAKTEIIPSRHHIMKFKEKFPNHIHRNLMTDENYDGFQEDLRELLRQNTVFSKAPRTVPGVRTGGQTLKETKLNRSANGGEDDDVDNLHNRFEELGANFKNQNGEYDANWAKKLSSWDMNRNVEGLPQIGSSESSSFYRKTEPWAPIVQDIDTRVSTSNSSSGSDSTLPPISRGSSGSEGGRVPIFCHQCGTKYPITAAKYCCECGARRVGNGAGSTIPSETEHLII